MMDSCIKVTVNGKRFVGWVLGSYRSYINKGNHSNYLL